MTWIVEFFDAFEAEFDAFRTRFRTPSLQRPRFSNGKARNSAGRTQIR
jgi:hypothetical protein